MSAMPTLTLIDARHTATVTRALDAHVMDRRPRPVTIGVARFGSLGDALLGWDGRWYLNLAGSPAVHGVTTKQAVSIITDWARQVRA